MGEKTGKDHSMTVSHWAHCTLESLDLICDPWRIFSLGFYLADFKWILFQRLRAFGELPNVPGRNEDWLPAVCGLDGHLGDGVSVLDLADRLVLGGYVIVLLDGVGCQIVKHFYCYCNNSLTRVDQLFKMQR